MLSKEVLSELEVSELRQKTISGISWLAISQIGRQGLQFFISIVLARLLTPYDFGLVGMIYVFIGFAALFREIGFSDALIQRTALEDRHYSSVFWLNIALGLTLTALLILLAPSIAAFYHEEKLTPLTRLLALSFLVASLSSVHAAILTRAMAFRFFAMVELGITAVSGGTAISLALMGYGAWSLVWQELVLACMTAIALWWVTGWRPKRFLNRAAIGDLIQFSGYLFASQVANYLERNADNLLVGKFIGTFELGVYSRAYSTMLLPLGQIRAVIGRAMFPALSRIQDNKAQVKRIYLRCLMIIALISFPVMMGLFTVADHFVSALYGQKWEMVVDVLRILCIVGLMQSLTITTGWIYASQGRTDWLFKFAILAGLLLICGFVVGTSIGTIEAVAYSYAIGMGVILYWDFTIPGKLIGLTFVEVARSVGSAFFCAAAMASAVWVIGVFMPPTWPHWAFLTVQIPFGIVCYTLLVHLFSLEGYRELRGIITEQIVAKMSIRNFGDYK